MLPEAEEIREDEPSGGTAQKSAEPFHVTNQFEVSIPERLAAAKLRGFVEDFGGVVLASEPGVIRMRLGVPEGYREQKEGSGVFGWFAARRPAVPRGQEPIEVELQLDKPDPNKARLYVVAAFRPMKDYWPKDVHHWESRCDKLNTALRQYLGA